MKRIIGEGGVDYSHEHETRREHFIDLANVVFEDAQGPFRDAQEVNGVVGSKIEYSGKRFDISISNESSDDGDELIRIYIDYQGKEAYKGYVHITHGEGVHRADLGIGKVLKDSEDLKGLGIGLRVYQDMLEYLKYKAEDENIVIKDEVDIAQDYPYVDMGLKRSQWDAVFVPILEKYGYTLNEGSWSKIYTPLA